MIDRQSADPSTSTGRRGRWITEIRNLFSGNGLEGDVTGKEESGVSDDEKSIITEGGEHTTSG